MSTEAVDYRVVVNDEQQYSLWPVHGLELTGWHDAGFTGSREECLDHIAQIWTDLRPASVREHLG